MSTEPKMTPWFVNGRKPARIGPYNVSCRKTGQTGKWWSWWSGKRWSIAAPTLRSLVCDWKSTPAADADAFHKAGSWRGLASKP